MYLQSVLGVSAVGRTPPMVAGLADHACSIKEVLCYKVALASFKPSKRALGLYYLPQAIVLWFSGEAEKFSALWILSA